MYRKVIVGIGMAAAAIRSADCSSMVCAEAAPSSSCAQNVLGHGRNRFGPRSSAPLPAASGLSADSEAKENSNREKRNEVQSVRLKCVRSVYTKSVKTHSSAILPLLFLSLVVWQSKKIETFDLVKSSAFTNPHRFIFEH